MTAAVALLVAALAIGSVVGWCGPVVLRRLPSPVDASPDVYRRIPAARFAVGSGCVSAAASLVVLTTVHQWAGRLPWLVLSTAGVLLVCIDACTGYLPARGTSIALVMAAAAVLLMAVFGADWTTVGIAAVSGVGAAVLFAVLWLVGRGAVGFGDVKFAPLIGAAAGASSPAVLAAALLMGSIGAVAFGLAYQAVTRRRGFPYTPGLALGAFAALLLFG